jgi:hypothetical protein
MVGVMPSANSRRIGKLTDAFSATSVIAYVGTLDLSAGYKNLLLLLSPWIALIGNSILLLVGIYLRGYLELFSQWPITRPLVTAAQATLTDPTATEVDKQQAKTALDEVKANKMRVYANMHLRLSDFFERIK